MPKFKKKPVVIEAFQWIPDKGVMPKWLLKALEIGQDKVGGAWYGRRLTLKIYTLEGVMTAISGDWIIQGIDGELYPCKPDIFEKTYDKGGDLKPLTELTEAQWEVVKKAYEDVCTSEGVDAVQSMAQITRWLIEEGYDPYE